MELNWEHANIGATVTLVKGMHKLFGDDGQKVEKELAELFVLESDKCSFKASNNKCLFEGRDPCECNIGNCPLDKETAPNKFSMEKG